jgi:protein-disulfide isomerase
MQLILIATNGQNKTNIVKKCVRTLGLICFLGLNFFRTGFADASSQKINDDVSALKSQIATIKANQAQELSAIDEIEQLLKAKSAPAQPAVPSSCDSGTSATSPIVKAPSTLSVKGLPAEGNDKTAEVGIIEYVDYECPFCGSYARDTFPQIDKDYIKSGKIKYFSRDFPLPIHLHAMTGAEAARCSNEQGKFWEMHYSLFANQSSIDEDADNDRAQAFGENVDQFKLCLTMGKYTADINKSVADAKSYGISGSPTFFVGRLTGPQKNILKIDKTIVGAQPFDIFKAIIDQEISSRKS